jgi:tetratricopeptide (TPR) repeat protein
LEALLLDSMGYVREAEKAFRDNIAGFMEAELYKDAFVSTLTLFESHFRRGAFDKAARACEEALAMIEQAGSGCHSQMSELWRDLLALINARRLTERQVLVARQYLVRHWNAPARHAPLELAAGRPEPSRHSAETVPAVETSLLLAGPGDEPSFSPSAPVTDLGHGGYEEALKRYDRDLLAASLARCGGRIRETSRLLGISRNTLRAKIKRHGLAAGEPEPAPADPGRVRTAEAVEALKKIHAHAWWAELKRLPHREQLERIRTVAAVQTREMVETILREASTAAPNDPRKGQQTALLAHTLAGLLPRSRCPEPLRNDLQAAALLAVAESRRSAGDPQGVAEALGAVRSHLERGAGEPSPAARLLAAQASLASDRGQVEPALALLERAAALYRWAQDPAAVAAVKVQEAGALRAARRHEEALARAQEALRALRAIPRETPRLAIQAWAVQVESLVFLERPKEALRSLRFAELRYEDSWGFRTDPQWEILGAFVLESLGYARDADSLFRGTLARFREAGLHKDASLILLSRCELLLQREELDRAVKVCEAALAGSAVEEPWRSLLPLARERRLKEGDLREARACILRSGFSGLPARGTPDPVEPPASIASLDLHAVLITPPDPVASLAEEGYKQALERYDRQLIAAGLAQCQGRIAETCRLLGLSPKNLRAKLRRYFLTGVEDGEEPPSCER